VLLEQAKAAIPPLLGYRDTALFMLAALLGHTPGDLPASVAMCARPPTIDRLLPIGDGVQLLRRRPDLREAERNFAAATDRIGVATADLYPTVTLGGSVSSSATNLAGLGKTSNGVFSVGPLLSYSFPICSYQAVRRSSLGRFGDVRR
jgi:outer membrane protein TolC